MKYGDCYPVTLDQTQAVRERFPGKLCRTVKRDDNAGSNIKGIPCPVPMFSIQDLGFSYAKDRPVIKALDLELDQRPTAIIGQNGAGKTTLVKLLKGLLKPDSGRILLQGEDMGGKTVAGLAGRVGYVFQNPDDQIFKNRVLDEVMVGPVNLGMGKADSRKRAVQALEIVGLSAVQGENPYDLDLADRKMVAIASVLAMEPQVLILDEPTIAQDAQGRRRLGSIVRKLAREGKTVLAILHDMDFAASYFERIIARANTRFMVMSGGQYELKRCSEEDNRGKSGLGLNVVDHYNGTQRSVRTLSGGESFQASLSLALGLSDEIQSAAGGIRLDTMFVDEGFGSLDEDTLNLAMKALGDLAEGRRLVGIISHVTELKERIERQIVVVKEKSGGSRARIQVL